MKFKIMFSILLLLLSINTILSLENGVYFYESTDVDGENLLRPVFHAFDSNGEIAIGNKGDSYTRVYLSKGDGIDPKNHLGYLKNIIIKKDGNDVRIIFKKGGEINKGDYIYDKIKEGGAITFNDKGDIIKADIESTEKATYYFHDKAYDLPEGVHLIADTSKIDLSLSKQGSFSVYNKNEPDKKTTYNDIKQGGSFSFDISLGLTKAEFETGSNMDLKYKGYTYPIPADTKVKIGEDKKVSVTLPDGTKLEEPQKDSGADNGAVFSFKTKSGGEMTLPNGEIIKNKNTETIIGYQDGFYLEDRNYAIITNRNEELLIYNPNKLYLAFEESKIQADKSYLYLGKDKIIASSINSEGAGIYFNSDNRIGFTITNDNTVSVQAKNGVVIVEKPSNQGEMPGIKLSGNSMVNLDKRSIYAESNNLYFDSKGRVISDFNQGRLSSQAKITLIDNSGVSIKDFDVYANDRDQYAAVKKSDFKSSMSFYKTSGGFYISPQITFNQLTPDVQKFYSELDAKTQQQVAVYANNGERQGAAVLQRTIQVLIIEEENIRRNPYKASVRIPTGGGSGTIIGIDKNGYPIVLTAGHLGGATRPGYKETIQMSDKRQFKGTVIGGISDWRGSGWDVALIKGDTIIDKIPYVPVAPETHVVKPNDIALRIGCPGCGQFKQTQTRIGKVGNIIGATDYIIGGESGGGLFHNGRQIGIVSTGGYYTGTPRIREFLRKYGYDYLIKYLIPILKRFY
ncbi:MAG: hypothetical protein Q8N99_05410 [Nanoarchaeota archaeon]|nr:hypothetical protein [Nanoarchaeota archaeon]